MTKSRTKTWRGAFASTTPGGLNSAGQVLEVLASVRAQQLQLRLWHVQLAVAGQRMSVRKLNTR